MAKLVKVIKHIKNGTLKDRVMFTYEPFRRKLQMKRWDKIVSKRDNFIYPIAPGIKLYLYSDDILSHAIFVYKFETQELNFLSIYLQKGDHFIDIGCNFGLYSLVASKKVGREGKVFAFEPVSKTHERLERNIRLNRIKNITPTKAAISSTSCTMPMSISLDGHDAWNSLTKPARGEKFLTEEVKTITLDDFVQENDLHDKIKMIKIDVEGWECEVIKGAIKTLTSELSPVLQVEFSEPALEAAGTSSGNLIKLLAGFGYKMYKYSGKNNEMVEFEYHGEPLDRNLYAIKKIDLVRQALQTK